MSLSADLSCLQTGAGAERDAALASLEKQLICPICLEIFNKPVVILPCQHNLCRRCANELYQPSLFQARTTMLVNSGRFRCPSCRHEVVLDRHGVYGLQRNLLVENIIDVYKQEVCKCISISPLPPPPLPAAPEVVQATCSDHEGEKVNIYCLTCRVPTCSLCKVFGAHQSCTVAPLSDVYQQQKDELNEGLNSLAEHRNKIQAFIDEINQMCTDMEEAYEKQKQTVSHKFHQMFAILEERRKSMTEVMSAEEEEKTGRAQALLRCYGDTATANTILIERAQSNMDDPDTVAFVQSSRELLDKLIAANTSCPTETLDPDDENLSHYKYNFSPQYRALLSLDFPNDSHSLATLLVEEDVPEEPEPVPEPESESETEETDLTEYEDTSVQYIEPPSPTGKDSPLIVPPSPVLVRDSETEGPEVQQDTDHTELRRRGTDQCQIPTNTIRQIQQEAEERPHTASEPPVKEETQESVTTLQVKEAWSDSSEAMIRQPEQLTQDTDGTEDEKATLEVDTDALFSPGWFQHSSLGRDNSVIEGNSVNINDTETHKEMSESKMSEEVTQTDKQDEPKAVAAPQLSCPFPNNRDVMLDEQNQTQGKPLSPSPIEMPITESNVEENEVIEDLQDWECLSKTGDEDFDGEDRYYAQSNADNSSITVEEGGSGIESLGLHGDIGESGKNNKQQEEQSSQNHANEEISSCRGNERDVLSNDFPRCENKDSNGLCDKETVAEEDSSSKSEQDEPKGVEQPQDPKMGGSAVVQAVTLVFYLLAFLVILQRFWIYIGQYILI